MHLFQQLSVKYKKSAKKDSFNEITSLYAWYA